MIVYNVTINIDDSVHDEWLDWMKSRHIPDVMNTGLFTGNRIYRVIGDDDSGGKTYSVQYTCSGMEQFKQYESVFAPALRSELVEKFKDKFVAFRTLLETV